jgi:hypothetical protein
MMTKLKPVSEAIPNTPVAKAKYAVVLSKDAFTIRKPMIRIPDESVTMAYTISKGEVSIADP